MKHTAFTEKHIEKGGKMVPFAGYNMPVQFEGVTAEHITVRKSVGVFDVSHMGEFWVRGEKAFEFVQSLTSNDVAALHTGKVQYSCFPNDKGGIVDDLLVYEFSKTEFLLVVNASNIEKDWNWVMAHEIEGVELENASDDIAQLAVQGPLALKAMQKLTEESVEDMEYYTHKTITFAGVENILFSTTGYTGSGGCEIYIKNEDAAKVYDAVYEAGAEFGIKSIGLAARDTLRLESGFCLYGNDLNDETSPIEAGLGWITKFAEGNDFTQRAHHEEIKSNGPTKRLRGFEFLDRGIPRQHYDVCTAEGEVIGEVTSGTMSPMLNKGIGMAYINTAHAKFDSEIYIKVRKNLVKAKICRIPFYKA